MANESLTNAIVGLLGVVVGAGISIGYDEYKRQRAKADLLDSLRAELRSNLLALPKKRQLLDKAKRGPASTIVVGINLRFMQAVYGSNLPAISAAVTDHERYTLHQIYAGLARIDQEIERILGPVSGASVESFLQAIFNYTGLVDETESLMKRFLMSADYETERIRSII